VKKIKDTSVVEKRIKVIGDCAPRIDPREFAKRLGAEYVAEVDGVLGGLNLYLLRRLRHQREYRKHMANLKEIAATVSAGTEATFRPHGRSMTGRVNDGDEVTVAPITADTVLKKGCVVLVTVKGNTYLHLIKAVGSDGRFQIGNNKGGINGWVKREAVHGIMTERKK
jgi:hypothetical protein